MTEPVSAELQRRIDERNAILNRIDTKIDAMLASPLRIFRNRRLFRECEALMADFKRLGREYLQLWNKERRQRSKDARL